MISINAKRLMAYVLALAMLLAGFVYVPKTADAAEEDTATPEVSVLGATLRLSGENDNNGTQSMRVGIKVSNARYAKSCAIKLTVKGKSYTVSTERVEEGKVDMQHNFVHSYDEDTDSIVYAVVITGIPKSSFYDQIKITGYAGEIIKENEQDKEIEHKSSTEARNVMGVVESLQKTYPNLNIEMRDGNLYSGTNDAKLTVGDLAGYKDDGPSDGEIVNLSTFDNMSKKGTCEVSDDGIFTGEGVDQISFRLNRTVKEGESIEVGVYGSVEGNTVRIRPEDGQSEWVDPMKWSTGDEPVPNILTVKKGCSTNKIEIKTPWNTAPVDKITITKIVVRYISDDLAPLAPGEVDLSTMKRLDGTPTGIYDEETETVKIIDDEANSRYLFDLPKDLVLEAGDKIKVKVNGNFADKNDGFRVIMTTKDGEGWDRSDQGKYEPAVGEVNYTCTLTLNKADGAKPFRPDEETYITIAHYGKPIKNLTINKITVTKLAPGEVDLSTIEKVTNDDAATGKYDGETGKVTINDDSYTGGYLFKLPEQAKPGDKVLVRINGKFTGPHDRFRTTLGIGGTNLWDHSDIDIIAKGDNAEQFNYEHIFTMKSDAEHYKGEYLRITSTAGWDNPQPISNFTINKITAVILKPIVLEPGDVDLSTVDPQKYYDVETGKIVIDDSEGGSQGCWNLPETLSAGDKVKITVKGKYTGNRGFRFWIGNYFSSFGDRVQEYQGNYKQGDFEETFYLTANDTCEKLTFKGFNGGIINGLEINKITAVKETSETPEENE